MAILKRKLQECCTCQAVESYGKDHAIDSSALLIGDKDLLKCSSCGTIYTEHGLEPKCEHCGRIQIKYFCGKYRFFYFCPFCFSIAKDLRKKAGWPNSQIKILHKHRANRLLFDDITSYSDNPKLIKKGSLLITGGTGSGKTAHALFLGLKLTSYGLLRVRFIDIYKYLNDMKRLFGYYDAESKKRLQELYDVQRSEILIMDGLNLNRKLSEFEHRSIFDIVDLRYQSKKPVIITASGWELKKNLGPDTVSRIESMSYHHDLGNTDWRGHDFEVDMKTM